MKPLAYILRQREPAKGVCAPVGKAGTEVGVRRSASQQLATSRLIIVAGGGARGPMKNLLGFRETRIIGRQLAGGFEHQGQMGVQIGDFALLERRGQGIEQGKGLGRSFIENQEFCDTQRGQWVIGPGQGVLGR